MTGHVGGLFERVGLTYNPHPQVVPNTRLARRLAELARTGEAQSLGIQAIPAFALDSRLLILGAQPQAVFEQAFEQLEAGG
jgi:predicted DsbA family dithiol-disulfide isomerase